MQNEDPEILIIDDNPADRMLILEALADSKRPPKYHLFEDGEVALEFLRQSASKNIRFRPNLILLDLNLPKKDGHEVLEEIKADEKLKSIPVVILTSSASPQDINACYNAGASCYVVKAFGLDNFITTVKIIEKFWLSVAILPKRQIRDENAQ